MANFEIHLVKLGRPSPNESEVTTRLKQLFDRVIREGQVHGCQEVRIHWQQDCPASLSPDQLLVYVVQDTSDSVVHSYFRPHDFAEGGGFTAWNDSVTASEVYISGCDGNGAGVANMIFHEAMHNKGHWPNSQLHSDFGGHGLAGADVAKGTNLNSVNIQRMAGALAARHPQWLGGCTYFNDPMRLVHAANLLLPIRPCGYSVAEANSAVRGRSYRPGTIGLA